MSDYKASYIYTVIIILIWFPITIFLSLSIMILSTLRLISKSYAWWLHRNWGKSILFLARVKVKMEGLENIPKEDGFLIVSNHQSAFDIPLLLGYFPRHICYLAKHTLFKIPIMGQAMKQVGHLPVHRGRSSKALGLLKAAAQSIGSGSNIVIFPEGTRGPGGKTMLKFKKGGFVLARLSKKPLLPLAIVGSADRLPNRSLKPCPGNVLIRIGEPIDPAKKTPEEIAESTQKIIQSMLNKGYE